MEKAYDRFKERKAYRRKVFGVFTVFAIIAVLVGVYTYFVFKEFSDYWNPLILLCFFFSLIYVMSRPWATETVENSLFVRMYDALKLLELCSDDIKASHFYSEKAAKKVRSTISTLRSFKIKLGETHSSLVNKSFEPFEILTLNLETRILPRILAQKDVYTMTDVLRGLAQLFGDINWQISLEDIIKKNKDLECFEQITIEEKPSRISTMLSKESIKFSYSIVLGVVIVFLIAFGHSMWFKYNLAESLSDLMTFLEVTGGGIAMGIGIYGIRKLK